MNQTAEVSLNAKAYCYSKEALKFVIDLPICFNKTKPRTSPKGHSPIQCIEQKTLQYFLTCSFQKFQAKLWIFEQLMHSCTVNSTSKAVSLRRCFP